jgi:YYY domain-containing protein
MLDFIFWYLIIFALGWIIFPVLFKLLPNLPGRGFSFSKPFGLVLWGYLYWALGRLGITTNSSGGLLFTLLLAGILGLVVFQKNRESILDWIRENRSVVLTTEIFFLAAFVGLALIRSLNPEILGTEKPMELAFINAILNSDSFPPHDPWLSGYAISYYYFGYILVAMLAKLSGTLGSVAFNLGVSLIFALSAVGSFGLLYNLLALKKPGKETSTGPALLAPLFTLMIGNWEGFLHYIHAKGLFWKSGGSVSAFWSWLDIQDLVAPPTGDSFGHWWWWRASRVIQDYDFSGFGKEVISEFPFFSFLLADLHPHVLSLPFVFLILGFALELYLKPKEDQFRWLGLISLDLSPVSFIVLAWLAGGMAFLNTWNFPMYVGMIAGAYVFRNNRYRTHWTAGVIIKEFILLGLSLGVTGGVLYLPWYLGFASQAGGLIPNVLYITRGAQFWVMFGPLLVPILTWLVYTWRRSDTRPNLKIGASLSGILVLGLLVLMLAMIGAIKWLPYGGEDGSLTGLFLGSVGGTDLAQVLTEGLLRRIIIPGTLITLIILSVLGFGLVFYKRRPNMNEREIDASIIIPNHFVILLILGGMALTLFPEFVFLRDLFGYRINTIFKFYYQAWLMWSIAAAYGMIELLQIKRSPTWYVVSILLIASLTMALFYPVISIQSKTNNFARAGGMTLDGAYIFPETDTLAVEWLRMAPPGVIGEAVGGSYSTPHARMATYSGKPTVLGWDFHEIQWRGGSELVMPRKEDMAVLYCSPHWETAKLVLEKYSIRYLVVGDIEHTTYEKGSENCANGLYEDKFIENMVLVFRNERLSIYTLPEILEQE